MTDRREQKLRELEEELRILGEENSALVEQGEQTALLAGIAESLLRGEGFPGIVAEVLESISILCDVSYCSVWEPAGSGWVLVQEYAAFSSEGDSGALLDASVVAAPIAAAMHSNSAAAAIPPEALVFDQRSFVPSSVAIAPFDTTIHPSAVLLVADDRRQAPSDLLSLLEKIAPVVHLARTRLDIVAANERLMAMSAELEERILERTGQLADAQSALHIEIERRRRSEASLRDADVAVESGREGVVITDAAQRILSVNRAFSEITGYAAEEAIGQTPKLLRSDRHDETFYRAMWTAIRDHGRWEGEIWNRRKDGTTYAEHLTITAVPGEQGEIAHYVGVFSDISVLKWSQAELERITHYDRLTELPNRLLFQARLDYAVDRAVRESEPLAIAIIGVDRFTAINVTFGNDAGDAVLRELAVRLKETFGSRYTVARLAGDEFALLLEGLGDEHAVQGIVTAAFDAMEEPLAAGDLELFVTASAGVAVLSRHERDGGSLLRDAYAALVRAKQSGRRAIRLNTDEVRERVVGGFHIETELRRALRREEFVVWYQPVMTLETGLIAGVEALVRWKHPDRGLLLPGEFIATAEDSGLIDQLGAWVLEEACREAVRWSRNGLPPLNLAVNLSPRQLRANLLDAVDGAISASGLDPERLELEITEGTLVQQAEDGMRILRSLRDRGVQLAVDDFGSGYSSLAYLKTLPLNKLKIDRMFVHDLPHSSDDDAIAQTIITLAHGLGLTVVAEGVETEAQAHCLRGHACDQVQGYLYGRAVPGDEIVERWSRA